MNLHLFLYIVNNLLNLLKVGVLDILRLWTLLAACLLLAALELVATRLSCCAALLVHLL